VKEGRDGLARLLYIKTVKDGFINKRCLLHHIGENLAQSVHWFKKYSQNSNLTVNLRSGQIAVKEGHDGLAMVRDLVIVVII